jgi:hypothetical protein
MYSEKNLTGCKPLSLVSRLFLIFYVGSDGFIVKLFTFGSVSQGASGTLRMNYRRLLMKLMNAPYEISIRQTGSLPTVFSNVSQWLFALSVSRN